MSGFLSVWRGLAAVALCTTVLAAVAQTEGRYPARPVTVVVPFTAAGPTDGLARALAQGMRQSLGQPLVVDNKPGAGGNIGTVHVVKSAADGYTLLFGSSGPLLINTSLYKNPGFDPLKDFTPIAYVGEIPNVLVVNAASPIRTLTELVAYAKGREGLSYASSGNGSTNHLAGEMFNRNVGAKLMHVPYKGTAPALNDLLGNQVTMMYLDVLTAAPHIKSGKLRPLAVAASGRSKVLPEVPTFRELGVPLMDQGVAFGLVGPAGLPRDVVDRLSAAAQAALRAPDMQSAFARLGVETSAIDTPQKYADYFREQVETWREVVRATGASAD
ncbi:tripartite tricarboxylate transporter substrate binding protein [Aquabacterium sp. J223]|uniref:Bug family tripartite tricarboxylate transporter substrate binding protein n=1 Tax=Aquabacterium sp. J223 TaxID=2898431 RepID=UPI0021ADAF96|nr:tripartite tricarboxylate transporter substrate binding protein [Aquabacterium sp. J223]UUX93994.1 tripartite tricarboxylate transporter substrate binding protein [Aquabacterium sp. J223]